MITSAPIEMLEIVAGNLQMLALTIILLGHQIVHYYYLNIFDLERYLPTAKIR